MCFPYWKNIFLICNLLLMKGFQFYDTFCLFVSYLSITLFMWFITNSLCTVVSSFSSWFIESKYSRNAGNIGKTFLKFPVVIVFWNWAVHLCQKKMFEFDTAECSHRSLIVVFFSLYFCELGNIYLVQSSLHCLPGCSLTHCLIY